jgi:hypothetical protein
MAGEGAVELGGVGGGGDPASMARTVGELLVVSPGPKLSASPTAPAALSPEATTLHPQPLPLYLLHRKLCRPIFTPSTLPAILKHYLQIHLIVPCPYYRADIA